MPARIATKDVEGFRINGKIVGGMRINGKIAFAAGPRRTTYRMRLTTGVISSGPLATSTGYDTDVLGNTGSLVPNSITHAGRTFTFEEWYSRIASGRTDLLVDVGTESDGTAFAALDPIIIDGLGNALHVVERENQLVRFPNAAAYAVGGSYGVGVSLVAPSDTPGTLAVNVAVRSGRRNFVFSVADINGIRSITSATVTARDGQQASVLGDLSRTDANTFSGTDIRRNARWNSGTMSVTYVDATSGESHTLTETWAVQ